MSEHSQMETSQDTQESSPASKSQTEGACTPAKSESSSDFACLLGAYFILRLPWTFMLPMSEAPDEFAHFWVIRFLKEHLRLPQAPEVAAGGPSAVYGSLPQLGYIPHVICSYFMPDDLLVIAERFGSIFMGAVMLFASYKIALILFPAKNRLLSLALPAAIISHPQMVFIHSYANNDSTSSALASLLLWLSFESVKSGIKFNRTLAIGLLAGWLAICKYSGLAVLPPVALCLLASCFLHGTSPAFAAGALFCGAASAALIALPWFIQNNQQYPGDFMGTKTMYKSWALTFNRPLEYHLPASHIIKDHRWWRMTFFSYWALFGYMTKYIWRPAYFIYLGIVIASVFAWLKGAFRLKSGFPPKESIVIWTALFLVYAINISSMIWASTKNLGGPQGRYLITSEIPVMALIIGGLSLLGSKYGKALIIFFLAFNLLVTAGSFIYLFNLYGGWHIHQLF